MSARSAHHGASPPKSNDVPVEELARRQGPVRLIKLGCSPGAPWGLGDRRGAGGVPRRPGRWAPRRRLGAVSVLVLDNSRCVAEHQGEPSSAEAWLASCALFAESFAGPSVQWSVDGRCTTGRRTAGSASTRSSLTSSKQKTRSRTAYTWGTYRLLSPGAKRVDSRQRHLDRRRAASRAACPWRRATSSTSR